MNIVQAANLAAEILRDMQTLGVHTYGVDIAQAGMDATADDWQVDVILGGTADTVATFDGWVGVRENALRTLRVRDFQRRARRQ